METHSYNSKTLVCITDEKIADYMFGSNKDEKEIDAYMSQSEENLDEITTVMLATRLQTERDRARDAQKKKVEHAVDEKSDTLEIEVHTWVLVLIAVVFVAVIVWAILK